MYVCVHACVLCVCVCMCGGGGPKSYSSSRASNMIKNCRDKNDRWTCC